MFCSQKFAMFCFQNENNPNATQTCQQLMLMVIRNKKNNTNTSVYTFETKTLRQIPPKCQVVLF